jgi:hypothetical protein
MSQSSSCTLLFSPVIFVDLPSLESTKCRIFRVSKNRYSAVSSDRRTTMRSWMIHSRQGSENRNDLPFPSGR